MISKDNKTKAIALTQVNKNDVGSPQAQVSVLTARIKEVTEHLKANKHDSWRAAAWSKWLVSASVC